MLDENLNLVQLIKKFSEGGFKKIKTIEYELYTYAIKNYVK